MEKTRVLVTVRRVRYIRSKEDEVGEYEAAATIE